MFGCLKKGIKTISTTRTHMIIAAKFLFLTPLSIRLYSGYKKYLHGQAVAMGMCAAADLAARLTLLHQRDADKIRELVKLYNLPPGVPSDMAAKELINAMEIDKKAKAGRLQFILPESIGSVRIEEDVDREEIARILNA